MDETKGTGERLLAGYFDRYSIEHLHRYALSQRIVSGRNVLDIASGEGYGSHLLAKYASTVIGVDIDPVIVKHASDRYQAPNLRFMQGSTDSIPVESSSIDIVISFETLEHHDRHEEMYKEIKRVLVPDGLLIISTPDKEYFNDLPDHRNEYHVKELYKDEFIALTKRFFRNVSLRSQISSVSSVICGVEDSGQMIIYGGNHHEVYGSREISKPAYHICLASDLDLPTLEASAFESRALLAQQEGELLQLRRKVEVLNERTETLNTVCKDLRSSASFRVGRAILMPLRLLLGRE